MGQGQRRKDEEKGKNKQQVNSSMICSAVSLSINSKPQLNYRRLFSLNDASMGTQSP